MLYMTAFLSFSPFSVKEGHWQVGIRIKYLIPVNGFVGRERREKGKKSREMRWGGGALAEGRELRSLGAFEKTGERAPCPKPRLRYFCFCNFCRSYGKSLVPVPPLTDTFQAFSVPSGPAPSILAQASRHVVLCAQAYASFSQA